MPQGLGALIPNAGRGKTSTSLEAALGKHTVVNEADRVLHVPVTRLHANARQPRVYFDPKAMSDLADSIRVHGILQPLIVTPRTDGTYEIVAGERRHRAAVAVGLKTVPAIVREAGELERLELALIENIQRQDLDPIERASAYRKLCDEFGLTHAEAAQRMGKPRSVITNTLRLLELPTEIQRGMSSGTISEGHGKVLAGLQHERDQVALYQKIVANELTVREVEDVVERGAPKHASSRRFVRPESESSVLARELTDTLATRVTVHRTGARGTIRIHFSSSEELRDLSRRIVASGKHE